MRGFDPAFRFYLLKIHATGTRGMRAHVFAGAGVFNLHPRCDSAGRRRVFTLGFELPELGVELEFPFAPKYGEERHDKQRENPEADECFSRGVHAFPVAASVIIERRAVERDSNAPGKGGLKIRPAFETKKSPPGAGPDGDLLKAGRGVRTGLVT